MKPPAGVHVPSEKPSITPNNPPIATGRRASACNLLLLAVLILSLCSCATCRETAIQDAEYYIEQGKEARIAMYCVGTDGQIMGWGRWTSHIQAQVRDGNNWYWVNGIDNLGSEPTYSMRPFILDDGTEWLTQQDYVWWTVDMYKDMLSRSDEIKESGAKNPCDLGEDAELSWWKIMLIILVII
jgi:hypothetical protein